MKLTNVILATVFTICLQVVSMAQSTNGNHDTSVATADKAEVFYFHYTRRCATCNEVEKVTKEAVAEFYGDKVSFTSYNLDEQDGETKAKELEVSGQTLLIVGGATKINITNEGFMNARSNPEKLKSIIKEKIDPLL